MTNQEAFDVMVRHLRKQGRKSEHPTEDRCLYRGPDGLMCAVGALIPDDQYRPEWDEKGVLANELPCKALRRVDKDLLRKMQYIHDFTAVEHWEQRFADCAERFNLTLPPLEASHA